MKLDDRAKLLLKSLIERYIAEGQPVGSRTLSRASGLELSPATIRNVMSDLEELGLVASPHTSAGRIPTARGYRLFVDTMLTAKRGDFATPSLPADQPQKVIANAAQMLSNLSQFVGVVVAPRRSSVFRHIEFLRLSERRFLVIIVSPEGDEATATRAFAAGWPAVTAAMAAGLLGGSAFTNAVAAEMRPRTGCGYLVLPMWGLGP